MKVREIEILQLILSDNYVNTQFLSQELNLSKRTIRYSICNIREFLAPYNCELNYSNMHGYHFKKADRLKVEVLVNEQLRSRVIISNYEERILYIRGLLLINGQFTISEVANKLYVDRNVVLKDLKVLKNEYNVQVTKNFVKMDFSVDQKIIFMLNLIMKITNHSKYLYNHQLLILFSVNYDEGKLIEIEKLVMNSNLNISDESIKIQVIWLVYYVIIDIKTISRVDDDLLDVLKSNLNVHHYNSVLDIFEALGLVYSANQNTNMVEISKVFLTNLSENYNINFDANNSAFDHLISRIENIRKQNTYGIDFKYCATKRVIRLYPYSYSIAQQLLNYHNLKQCSNEQVAYLCEYVQIVLFELAMRKEIIIVCDNHDYVVDYYINWIMYQYSKNIQIKCLSRQEFELLKAQNNVDLILDFAESTNTNFDRQIKLKQVLSIDNVNKIDYYLRKGNSNLRFMSKFINQGLLKIYLNECTVNESIIYVGEQLQKRHYILNNSRYVEECLKREQISSTYIGFNTMIMHPLDYNSKRNAIHISILHQPLVIKNEEVSIIFSCAFKENIDFEISRLFELIIRLVEVDTNQEQIINCWSELDLFIKLQELISNM